MPDSLRKLQEDQWGFTSYASIADSLSEIIIDASTENEMLQLISTYNDFLKIEDSTLTTQLPFMGHQCVANADGIFKVDSTYFRIFTEGIVGWIGATLTQIESLTLNEDFDDDLSDGKFFYIRNVELDPLESNCGNYHRVEKYTNNGMYRVIFEIWAKKEIYWGTKCPATNTWIEHHQYGCQIKVRSQVKRFWMWHSYKSSLEFQEGSCQLMVPRQVNYNYQNCSYIPTFELGGVYNISNSINNASFLDVWITGANNGMGDMTHNYSSLPLPVFLKVKGKGKSAALGINNWAEINCGY